MIEQWMKQLYELSGNFTTNERMPDDLIELLLEEDDTLGDRLSFEEITFPDFRNNLDLIPGLNILAGLQQMKKKGFLTVFRALRFPTNKRMYDALRKSGYAFSNYEQERILRLYQSQRYMKQRNEIVGNPLFWTLPQERVVKGLPIFYLVNDAFQIHRAFRGEVDRVAIVGIHIPQGLLVTRKISLIANAGIDLDYDNQGRDVEITEFKNETNCLRIDLDALCCRGVDLYEMYSPNMPWDSRDAKRLGIVQEFFLLDVYKINQTSDELKTLFHDTNMLKQYEYFLHGFFGDQNIFGRRPADYLSNSIFSIKQT